MLNSKHGGFMSKAKKITTIVFASILAVITIFLLSWYFGDSYKQFYPIATKEFEIAGLNDGFTPQGLCYNDTTNQFLTCGYTKNGTASRIYVVDGETNQTTKYFTLKDGEKDYVGHAGGIATNGVKVWVVGDKKVNVFAFSEIENVENGSSIAIEASFDPKNGADFVTVDGNYLWVGEFHKDGKYDTPDSHHIKSEKGNDLKALHLRFDIDNSQNSGVASTTANCALSSGSLVQGMVITSNNIILSTSYSLPNSKLYVYENVLSGASDTIEIDGVVIEHYTLQESNLQKTISAPCMSEEMTIANDKVYIMFESGCQKYRLFTREALKNVFSITLEKLTQI